MAFEDKVEEYEKRHRDGESGEHDEHNEGCHPGKYGKDGAPGTAGHRVIPQFDNGLRYGKNEERDAHGEREKRRLRRPAQRRVDGISRGDGKSKAEERRAVKPHADGAPASRERRSPARSIPSGRSPMVARARRSRTVPSR